MPAVSILVPIYNVERYLRKCLDTLVGQTLADIEFILIDDGSTDGSGAIIAEYALRDARIRVIEKPNTGYGDSMNQGLAAASGDYIGIVEPDDFVELDMFETLLQAARAHGVDIVRCNYYEHENRRLPPRPSMFRAARGRRSARDRRVRIYEEFGLPYGELFAPVDRPEVLTIRPSIWAGLYRRSMLVENGIDFAATPGASFQDTSFALMSWIAAERVVIEKRPLLHYRIDNDSSSVKSNAKVFAVCDEYERAQRFLDNRPAAAQEAFATTLSAMRYCSCLWNYDRILPEYHIPFAERWSRDMREAAEKGALDFGMLKPHDRFELDVLMADPRRFCERHPEGAEWSGYCTQGWRSRPGRVGPANRIAVDPDRCPFVSVVVPVYNVEPFIRECIESLVHQDFADFEVVVVDDGSTDASMEIARLAAFGDPRFKFIEKENGGLASARNVGIDQARGTYLIFLDSDDYYVPDALSALAERAVLDDLDYLDFTAHSFYESAHAKSVRNEDCYESRPVIEGVMSGPELFARYQEAFQYHCSACFHFFKRELLKADVRLPGTSVELGPLRFDEDLRIHEDELFSPLLVMRAQRSAYLPRALYMRRVRDESIITSKRGMRNVTCMYAVQKRLLRFMEAHARDLEPEFLGALAQRVVELREIIADDAARVPLEELRAHADSLDPVDRVDFELVAIQGGRALERARSALDYRIGRALLKVPRRIKYGV